MVFSLCLLDERRIRICNSDKRVRIREAQKRPKNGRVRIRNTGFIRACEAASYGTGTGFPKRHISRIRNTFKEEENLVFIFCFHLILVSNIPVPYLVLLSLNVCFDFLQLSAALKMRNIDFCLIVSLTNVCRCGGTWGRGLSFVAGAGGDLEGDEGAGIENFFLINI
jgi:hypothetical protein